MQPDLNLPADTTVAPMKKWFESEQRFELRFPCTLVAARSRLLQGITHQVPEKTGFWEARWAWEGEIENDNFRLTITISTGKGSITYKVFGKLLESENSTVVQIVVRDTLASGYILPVSVFLIVVYAMQKSVGAIVFFLIVIGCIFPFYLSNWQKIGLKKASVINRLNSR